MKYSVRMSSIPLLTLAWVLGGEPHPAAHAIEGVVQNPRNGHYYKYVTMSGMSWAACRSAAQSLGGYLATITSPLEEQWVFDNVVTGKSTAYLGGTDGATEGVWAWVTGEAWQYTNWRQGEPNDAGGKEDALEMYGTGPYAGQWNDMWDSEPTTLAYVVEWDVDPNAGTIKTPPNAPSSLSGTVSLGNPIKLLWDDNSDNEEAFEVERRTAVTTFSRVVELGPNSAVFEDVGTVPGGEYTYRVRAVNSGGDSDWSNEATVTASAIAPGPRAPSGLSVISTTTESVELAWSDNSVDEIGFEVHKRKPGGDFALVASLPPGSWGFTDTSLPPDMEYEYGVRSMNAFRTSGFCEVAAATLPTLSVTATRADLKDSPKFGKDSLKVQALFDFLPESPDGLWDVLAEGITLRAGPADRPVVMTLPKNLDTWKVKGTKATWKSAKGATPKYSIQVDTETRLVKASAAGLELPEPPVNPMRVSIAVGDDAGTAKGDWEAKKTGVFQLR